jgi:energy-converting hydrogenase Eha subunit B
MSILNKLTEGIVDRDLSKEGAALLTKWERTGLLEGIDNDRKRNSMARLLENQAKELLREASSMSGGDVEGFAAVAFPIVRRVFGGLIANDLVSVQPMSLPSGLIFFLDFTFTDQKLGSTLGESLYGGGAVGQQITGGVSLAGDKSFYNRNNGYSSPTASVVNQVMTVVAGVVGTSRGGVTTAAAINTLNREIRFDPDLADGTSVWVATADISAAGWDQLNRNDLVAITSTSGSTQVRRLTTIAGDTLSVVFDTVPGTGVSTFDFPITDNFAGTPAATLANALGAVVGDDTWGLENQSDIPEIDIKVDSVSITAITKKLKAKWTPELGQDLNAYHNLDAEVELTSILSEQIALEIDREILEDLIKGATASTLYWSRAAGRFVNRSTGAEIGSLTATPDFTGTVSEWYETLVETVNDVSAAIHRKTLRGGANFLVCGPEVANVLEFTAGFRADITGDADRGTVGAVKTGSLSKKWDVYVDPYFPRNVILVGRKGGSFLESGYVYSPYVPLQVTPTIFGTEDFVPRKGVMTRYGKKMVRPDMYGLVIVRDL